MLFSKNKPGLIYIVLILSCMIMGIADLSYSQNSEKLLRGNYSRNQQGANNLYDADSRYTIYIQDVSLRRALEIIANKAGLILSYRSGLFKTTDRISLDLRKMEVSKALNTVLASSSLDYKIMETRHLVIYHDKKVGRVKGSVFKAYSSEPLLDAKVFLVDVDKIKAPGKDQDITKSTKVSITGRFVMNEVEVGTYRLIIVDNGYKKIYKKIEIKDDRTTIENFRLKYPQRK